MIAKCLHDTERHQVLPHWTEVEQQIGAYICGGDLDLDILVCQKLEDGFGNASIDKTGPQQTRAPGH